MSLLVPSLLRPWVFLAAGEGGDTRDSAGSPPPPGNRDRRTPGGGPCPEPGGRPRCTPDSSKPRPPRCSLRPGHASSVTEAGGGAGGVCSPPAGRGQCGGGGGGRRLSAPRRCIGAKSPGDRSRRCHGAARRGLRPPRIRRVLPGAGEGWEGAVGRRRAGGSGGFLSCGAERCRHGGAGRAAGTVCAQPGPAERPLRVSAGPRRGLGAGKGRG